MPAVEPNPHYAPTADGAKVALRRHAQAGGPPVLFIHGLAANAGIWDLPEVTTAEFTYRSLADQLHDAGCDVWLMNLRGHGVGVERSTPAPGQRDWCVDHFIVYDLPAALAHLAAENPRPPVVIGASMGAMTLAAYLVGAAWDAIADRVHLDADAAAQRQAGLAAAVFCEFPAVLRWPRTLYSADGRLDWRRLISDWHRRDEAANFGFELGARAGWLQAVIMAMGSVPLSRFRGRVRAAAWYENWPAALATFATKLESSVEQMLLEAAGVFTGATNHRAEVFLRGRRRVVDDMKAGVLRQFARCVQAGAFVSALGASEVVYSDHYDRVTLPTLVFQGGRDRIANADVTRAAFFDVIRSADKEYLFDPDIAHGEIEAAPVASARVYPRIVDWVGRRQRSG